jgi:hypothetical protein
MYHSTTSYELSSVHQAELRQEVVENRLVRQGERASTERTDHSTALRLVKGTSRVIMTAIRMGATRFRANTPASSDAAVSTE